VARSRYSVVETTFEVEGGDPVDGLQHVLNHGHHRFVGATRVREPGGEWVDVVILERIEI
jgi:hypothetical protein